MVTTPVRNIINQESQYISAERQPGKQDFLKLLIAQLRNQDPLNPMEDKEFIAQLAQFNSLEQMINLNNSFERMLMWQQVIQASSLLGKDVKVFDQDKGEISGKVSRVVLRDGEAKILVNREEFGLSQIIQIS